MRRFWPNDTAAFIAGTVQEQYEGPCNAEDYLIMQLRLCSGLNLTEYAARYGVRFDAGQMAFLRHCAASGYAVLDGDTLRLTPSGMIVQNAILEELNLFSKISAVHMGVWPLAGRAAPSKRPVLHPRGACHLPECARRAPSGGVYPVCEFVRSAQCCLWPGRSGWPARRYGWAGGFYSCLLVVAAAITVGLCRLPISF